MSVTAAERDAKREQAFALSMQGISQREIAKQLGINKSTANNYVRIERQRRSHDRAAEDAIRDVVTMLRTSLLDLFEQLRQTTGTGPQAGFAKAKLGKEIRSTAHQLALVYGVTLPKIDGEEIAMDRLMEMVQKEMDAPPIGYPNVSEEAAYDAYIAEVDASLEQWRQQRRDIRRGIVPEEDAGDGYGFTPWQDTLDSHDDCTEGY
jgi:transcriptional regulator with XRE-family HTH domain